ncbi:hypothetical protein THITH_11535 [Thioalkalivibrio paradoxus ARh 1]|uniref:Low-complexity protein n=1 Tax=Thioalkalivibrio paradoxus ARh 1 TaxID=713585 RepID=W0DPJ4_9GAMM|nr:hypothetical protein THITH_11535 [Thioalkalivibrio paradoxus ARh 1]
MGTAAVGLAMGSTPLFAATDLGQGYQVSQSSTALQKLAQGSCGEGTCGGASGEKETEGSCGEGRCGGASDDNGDDKDTEGKCGEGRCGG